MIENSDRGITLNKGLAWTMLVALVSLVWYGGTTVSSLQSATEMVNATLTRTEATIATDRVAANAIEARVRALENLTTRQDARYDALSRSLDEVKAGQREANELLRQLAQIPPKR